MGYRRWKDFLLRKPGIGELLEFHTAHKPLLMAHGGRCCHDMDILVAHAGGMKKTELYRRYGMLFMQALSLHAGTSEKT
jgi:uncharacterized protein YbgA (DUF1722 family)